MQDLMKKAYTTTDVGKLGIKLGRLKEWVALGYIEPSIQKAAGAGTKSLFSLWDMYRIKLFEYLTDRGFKREEAASRVKHFPGVHEGPLFSDKLPKKNRQQSFQEAERIIEGRFVAFAYIHPPDDDENYRDIKRHLPDALYSPSDNKPAVVYEVFQPGDKIDMDKYKDYDDILIVNFQKIKDLVDRLIG